MYDHELEDRKKDMEALGEIVIKHHQRLTSCQTKQRTVNQIAANFGRYLQASRKSAGLSMSELAQKAQLSGVTLLALEQGLFVVEDIHPKWLKRVAQALGEDVEDFNLILGYRAGKRPSIFREGHRWLSGLNFKPRTNTKQLRLAPVYAACSAMLICFAIATLMNNSIASPQPKSTEKIEAFININSERRLNMIKAETRFEYQVISLPASRTVQTTSCCAY